MTIAVEVALNLNTTNQHSEVLRGLYSEEGAWQPAVRLISVGWCVLVWCVSKKLQKNLCHLAVFISKSVRFDVIRPGFFFFSNCQFLVLAPLTTSIPTFSLLRGEVNKRAHTTFMTVLVVDLPGVI